MNKQPFGKTGLSVSRLGFGAAPAAYLKADQGKLVAMLNDLLDSGLNVIDTAASYPGSEEFIGRHFSQRRDDYVLISKCGTKVPGIDAPNFSYELVSQTVDRALKLLQTDVIDVMLLHSCDLAALKKGDGLRALVEARDAGKIRFAGYSGDNEAAAYACTLPDIAVIETSINIADQHNIDLALPEARKHNIGVIAKRPIANAAWKDIATQPGLYANYAKTYTDRLKKMNLNPSNLGFPGAAEAAWPEMAIRFTLSQPGVHTAIIGTTNPDNARSNIAAVDKGPLPEEIVKKIREIFKQNDPRDWIGQT